jgi:hypothetical protein
MFNEQNFRAWLPNHNVQGDSIDSYINSLDKIELIGNININDWVPSNTQALIVQVEQSMTFRAARSPKTLQNYISALGKYHEFLTGVPFV